MVSISYMETSTRKPKNLKNEISKIIYGKNNLRILYNETKNRPSEVLIDEEQSSFDNVISVTRERYHNAMMKWDYPLRPVLI